MKAMDTHSIEFFQSVLSHLQTDAGLTHAYLEHSGGGIMLIVVPCGAWDLYFGTANEDWGADVYHNREFVDGASINTGKLIVGEPSADAVIIAEAAMAFDRAHS